MKGWGTSSDRYTPAAQNLTTFVTDRHVGEELTAASSVQASVSLQKSSQAAAIWKRKLCLVVSSYTGFT